MKTIKIDIRDIPTFYINLDVHVGKQKRIMQLLDKAGFKNVNRLSAIKNEKDGQLGLIDTHLKVLDSLKPPFLLLEDDVSILSDNFVIEVPSKADVIYLGNSTWGLWGSESKPVVSFFMTEFENLVRVSNMLSAHAILVRSSEFTSSIIDLIKEDRKSETSIISRIDQAYAKLQCHFLVYALNYPIFYQRKHQDSMTNNERYTNKRLSEYKSINAYVRKYLYRTFQQLKKL